MAHAGHPTTAGDLWKEAFPTAGIECLDPTGRILHECQRSRRVELWRIAASALRRRPPGGEHDPGEYALFGISRLLDALAGAVERGDELRDEVLSATDDLCRHIHHYLPKPDE
jgi:hypothetical protein